jgi:hypothetical protein
MEKVHKKIHHHLKHVFIPHEHNDYKPHFFREVSVGILIATSLALFSLSAGSAYVAKATEFGKRVIVSVLIDLTNKNRVDAGLTTLKHSSLLDDSSLLKARDMVENNYFAHESPTGVTPWHWFEKAGYSFVYAGENLAVNYFDSESVDKAWLNSPTHKANIVNPKFKEIGISARDGMYKGENTIYVVQMFGTPLSGVTEEDLPEAKEIVAIPEPKMTEEKTIKPVEKIAVAKPTETEIPEVKGEATTTVPVTFKNVNLDLSKEETYKPEANITDKAIFYGPKYINMAFMILFSVIFMATLLMVFIEIKHQHPKHIAYAVLLLIILLILMYFNVNYFELSFRVV